MSERNHFLDELWKLVRAIPRGRVMGYGQLGRMLSRPVSGLLVGKWMASAPDEVPWWRVVGADGSLKTVRRGPHVANEQLTRLEAEGVHFIEDRVSPEAFVADLD